VHALTQMFSCVDGASDRIAEVAAGTNPRGPPWSGLVVEEKEVMLATCRDREADKVGGATGTAAKRSKGGVVQQTSTATLPTTNASDKLPPWRRPAPTTATDLAARSSHRGVNPGSRQQRRRLTRPGLRLRSA
jgi:hypothetical protein